MMKHALLLSAIGCLAGGAIAQVTPDVLPKGSAPTADKQYEYILLRYDQSRYQCIYNTADFSRPTGALRQIAFRRNNYYGNSMPAGSLTLTLKVGYSTNTADQASTTFANNLMTMAPLTIFSGTVNFPTAPKGTGPAPFTHVIKAKQPTVITPAGFKSICFDFAVTARTGYVNSTYTLDSSGLEVGTRNSNPGAQSTCKFSNNKYNSGLGYTTAGLNNNGGNWYVRYSNILPNAPGLMTISAFGVKAPGTWPLPISLAPLGAPGCSWNVGLETGLWFPLTANASGSATGPTLQIPAGLGGVSFYDHTLWLDAAANKAGLVTGWSSEWYIGSGKGPAGATIYNTSSSTATSGSKLSNGEVLIMEVTY